MIQNQSDTQVSAMYYLAKSKKLWAAPMLSLSLLLVLHYLYLNYAIHYLAYFAHPEQFIRLERLGYITGASLSLYWLFVRNLNQVTCSIANSNLFKSHPTASIVLPFFSSVMKTIFFLVLFNLVTHYLGLSAELSYALDKLSSVLIIGAIGLILLKLVDIVEQILLNRYSSDLHLNNTARKIYTQALIFKRVAYSIIGLLTIGVILMLFENVRALGASVLTTAGIAGLVITFTAQRSLANLFSGLDMALTQPIKIGDIIVINNEFGTVEEINFRNVIVKLWDWRRLVVPTSYFLENSFQNWSREQDNSLIGVVDCYMDFTLPIQKVREELERIFKASSYWDGRVGKVVVNDLKETVMQLRILASAKNADAASNLRSEIREKLISYIATNFPESLPAARTHNLNQDKQEIQKREIRQETVYG